MQLNKIVLNNIGVFLGRHEIDLTPKVFKEKNKPIIIFGGMNGTGKTTIFDAIKLCLYGPEILGNKASFKYKKYLKEKINTSNGLLLKPNYASIELEFDYSSFGDKNTYTVKRYWEKNGKSINEQLFIHKDGKPVDEVDKDNWQGFIKEMLPLGLSQLFFFDGEKIQKIMYDEDNSELKRSIMTLLGLDLIERLQSDLKIYKRGLQKRQAPANLTDNLRTVETELSGIEAELQKSIYDTRTIHRGKIQDVEAEIAECENRIEAQGGGYFKRKDERFEKKKQIEEKLDTISEEIRKLAAGLLPISIVKDIAKNLQNQLAQELELQSLLGSQKILNDSLKRFSENVKKKDYIDNFKGISVSNKTAFRKALLEAVQSVFVEQLETPSIKELHKLSNNQSSKIINDIEYALAELPGELSRLTKEYEKTYRKLQKLHSDLEKVPPEDLMKPLYANLNSLNRKLGKLQAEILHREDKIASLEYKKQGIEREKNRISTKMEEGDSEQNTIKLINQAYTVLFEYHEKLSSSKIQRLQNEFTNIFRTLHRKEDLISKIDINPETLDIYIYDKYGSKINKNRLSSGELEIYAISMVWALAKISGQNLPFAVDTPLARLDSKHRDNLINMFFPNASHQMLIFSTDTEVDKKYFNKLKPFIARAYKFEYSDHEKKSEIHEGYFWS